MKKLLLVLIVLVLGLSSTYGQDYYVQITEAQKGDKFEPAGGEIFLYDNQFAGVNFKMIPELKHEERIIHDKSGYIKREGFFLFKEGKGMKTDFIYKIGIKVLDEKPPVEELKWVMIQISIHSITGKMNLKFKGLLQQVGL